MESVFDLIGKDSQAVSHSVRLQSAVGFWYDADAQHGFISQNLLSGTRDTANKAKQTKTNENKNKETKTNQSKEKASEQRGLTSRHTCLMIKQQRVLTCATSYLFALSLCDFCCISKTSTGSASSTRCSLDGPSWEAAPKLRPLSPEVAGVWPGAAREEDEGGDEEGEKREAGKTRQERSDESAEINGELLSGRTGPWWNVAMIFRMWERNRSAVFYWSERPWKHHRSVIVIRRLEGSWSRLQSRNVCSGFSIGSSCRRQLRLWVVRVPFISKQYLRNVRKAVLDSWMKDSVWMAKGQRSLWPSKTFLLAMRNR